VIGCFTRRVKPDLFATVLTLASICVYLRFISFSRLKHPPRATPIRLPTQPNNRENSADF
jgi:hypothetical protein